MNNYKYTNDGKKVIVIGKLNSYETIVQEIFVSGESEIPSGEHFVVKNLHDKPVESWKEKHLRELEENYEKIKSRLTSEYESAQKQLTLATAKAREKSKCLMAFADNSNDSQLDLLRSFLAGEITHYAILGRNPQIINANDIAMFQMDDLFRQQPLEATKLISVYGSSEGKLDYRIHDYKDGSGGTVKVIPCRSRQEAVSHLQAECDRRAEQYKADQSASRFFDVEKWLKIEGIVIPEDVMSMTKADKAKALYEKIEKAEKDIQAQREELDRLVK